MDELNVVEILEEIIGGNIFNELFGKTDSVILVKMVDFGLDDNILLEVFKQPVNLEKSQVFVKMDVVFDLEVLVSYDV